MNKQDIKNNIAMLAKSQGFYGRLLKLKMMKQCLIIFMNNQFKKAGKMLLIWLSLLKVKKEKRVKMKDIIDKFAKAHKDFKLYISYGLMPDIGLDCKTINTETYMISTIDRDFEFRANNEFNRTFFPECEHIILLGDNEYISTHNETDFKNDNFLFLFNVQTGEFKTFGNPNRAKILKAVTRLDNIIKGFKYINQYKDKGADYLDKTFNWLSFSMQGPNKSELHFDSNYISGGFCICYPDEVWEIDAEIDRDFERAMKRLLKYK